jgi:hypothetical protein
MITPCCLRFNQPAIVAKNILNCVFKALFSYFHKSLASRTVPKIEPLKMQMATIFISELPVVRQEFNLPLAPVKVCLCVPRLSVSVTDPNLKLGPKSCTISITYSKYFLSWLGLCKFKIPRRTNSKFEPLKTCVFKALRPNLQHRLSSHLISTDAKESAPQIVFP